MSFMRHHFGDPAAKHRGLWVHGWLGSGAEGEVLQKKLGEDYYLCCPDLPGHGGTPVADWNLSKTLAELARLAGEQSFTAGYSMGGRLLMMTAARFPQSISRLIIESSGLGFADPKLRAERREVDARRAEELQEKGLSLFGESWYQMDMWGGFTDFPRREGNEMELARALQLFSVGNQPDLRLWLQSTPKQILWIAGAQDPVYVEQAQWVGEYTRHPLALLEGGHNVHLQSPLAWAREVMVFLENLLSVADQ